MWVGAGSTGRTKEDYVVQGLKRRIGNCLISLLMMLARKERTGGGDELLGSDGGALERDRDPLVVVGSFYC